MSTERVHSRLDGNLPGVTGEEMAGTEEMDKGQNKEMGALLRN